MPEGARKGGGLDLAQAIWSRRKWLGLLVFAAPFTAAVSLVTLMPSVYKATATVLVDRQQVPETFVQPTVTSALETRLHTIGQEIMSRSRLEALIARFGLYPDLKKRLSPEEIIERMREDIRLELKAVDVKGERRATVAFTISYRGSDPRTVALVTNTLASFYIEENLKVRERQATGTAEFLRVQLDGTKKRLDEQERRVSEFKRRYLGELPQQMETNLATLERLHVQFRLNADNQVRAMERHSALAGQLAEADALAPPGSPEGAAARLARLRQELAELRTRFSDKYPDVIRVQAEVAALERGRPGGDQEPESVSPATPYVLRLKQAVKEVEAEIKILKGEETRLRAAIAAYQQRVEKTPQREQEFREIARDYEATRELYHSLLKRHEEAQIAESMEQRQKGEQFRILDPAVSPRQPVANSFRLILMALALSLGLAVGAVMLAEQLDTSFHSVDDLRSFSRVPVLVSIPKIVAAADVDRRRVRFRLAALAATAGLVALVGTSYLVAHGNEQLVWLLSRGGSQAQ